MIRPEDIRFCVAPMMDWTDRHCRYFHRLLARKARLYTEMLTTGAVKHGDRARLMGFNDFEQPVAFQLGGSDPKELALATKIVESQGYIEVNLNVGCPSDRVQNGAFGACLMMRPKLVADCVKAMKDATFLPITVKCRIGVDDQDPEIALFELAENCIAAGVDALFIHARKAWLKGLSPKENRDIPPLDYRIVHKLKKTFPNTPIAINGGLETIQQFKEQLQHVDGVMVGRAAYHNPSLLMEIDAELFNAPRSISDDFEAIDALSPYIKQELLKGERLSNITRHLLGLFAGQAGARLYRQRLTLDATKLNANLDTLFAAVHEVREATQRLQLAHAHKLAETKS